MTKKVVIIGAGGTGRELAELIAGSCEMSGFLDDRETGCRILGRTDLIKTLSSDHLFAGAIGSFRSMDARSRILGSVRDSMVFSFQHPRAFIYPSAEMGTGHLIFPGAVVCTDVTLGRHVIVYHNAVVSHDSMIGAFSVIANGAVISGQVSVGENTYIGAGATVLEGCRIGRHCIVAAGSTVISDVPDNSTWIGPKKILRNKYHINQD